MNNSVQYGEIWFDLRVKWRDVDRYAVDVSKSPWGMNEKLLNVSVSQWKYYFQNSERKKKKPLGRGWYPPLYEGYNNNFGLLAYNHTQHEHVH